MPDRIRYVNPDADAAGDGTTSATSSGDGTHAYDSCAAWEADTNVGNNENWFVYCERGTSTPRDTTALAINSLTIGTNSYVWLLANDTTYEAELESQGVLPASTANADASSYHYGVYDAGYVIYTTSNYTNVVQVTDNDVSICGIEIRSEPTVKSGRGFHINQTLQESHMDLIIRGSGSGVNEVVYNVKGILINSICDGYSVSTTGVEHANYGGGEIWNCLAADCSEGFTAQATGGTDPILVNCLAYNCTTDYLDNGGGWDTTNSATCATTDASAAESFVTVTSVSTTAGTDITNPATKDWTLTNGALDEVGTTTGAPAYDIGLNARS